MKKYSNYKHVCNSIVLTPNKMALIFLRKGETSLTTGLLAISMINKMSVKLNSS